MVSVGTFSFTPHFLSVEGHSSYLRTESTFYDNSFNSIQMCRFLSLHCSNQKTEEKRGGSGSNNWGNVKDEAK